jgi:hypothetical protein
MEDATDTTPDAHAPEMPTQVMALQPVAVVDHVVSVGTRFMAENVLGEVGGSKRVDEWKRGIHKQSTYALEQAAARRTPRVVYPRVSG